MIVFIYRIFRPSTRALSIQKGSKIVKNKHAWYTLERFPTDNVRVIVQKQVSDSTLCIKHNFQLKLVCSIHSVALLNITLFKSKKFFIVLYIERINGHTESQGTVLQLTTDHQMICAQVHIQCHKSYVRVIRQVHVICISKGMQKSLGCALYVKCTLSVGKYGIFQNAVVQVQGQTSVSVALQRIFFPD